MVRILQNFLDSPSRRICANLWPKFETRNPSVSLCSVTEKAQADHPSNADQFPGHGRGSLIHFHPCPARRSAAAGAAEGAGVENAGKADGFVARDMGVTVEQKICSADARRWNVDQEKSLPTRSRSNCGGRVETPVIVAKDAVKWPAHRLDRIERLLIAIVPEVPDLIGFPQLTGGGGGKLSVGIGNYGDEHGRVLSL